MTDGAPTRGGKAGSSAGWPSCGGVGSSRPGRGAPAGPFVPASDPGVGSGLDAAFPAPGTSAPHPDAVAVVVAGGSGSRFGDARGKQYVELCGMPLLSWSIVAFCQASSTAGIVVVCPGGRADETRGQVLGPLDVRVPWTLAPAGPTRQASVANGLAAAGRLVSDFALPCEYVAVHDGARPLVTADAIERVFAALREDPALDGALAAAPVTDTLKLADDGIVVGTPDRACYWAAQTPQAFRIQVLADAHAAAEAAGYVGTDDASLVEWRGGRVRCVATTRDNLKVTVPEDLAMAETLLRRRLGAEGAPAGGMTSRHRPPSR